MAVGDGYYAEYVDLSGQNKTCQSLPDFMLEDDSVGIYINDQPFVCGGTEFHFKSNEKGTTSYYRECFTYSAVVCTTQLLRARYTLIVSTEIT